MLDARLVTAAGGVLSTATETESFITLRPVGVNVTCTICATTVAYLFVNLVGLGQYAAALAAVVALCAIIPLIGSTLSMMIVSIVAFTFSPTQGFITLAFLLTYQQIDNYFIQPRVFQRSVSVPGPLVILAALAGGVLYGLLGALLAIPSMAAAMLLYREVLIPALNRR